MGSLQDYFRQQLAAGYDYDQLVERLKEQGYTETEIDKAYHKYERKEYEQQLETYIAHQVGQGIKPKFVREELLAQGYSAWLVDRLLYPHHSTSHHHIITVLVLLVIAVAIGIIFLPGGDTDTATVTSTVESGAPPATNLIGLNAPQGCGQHNGVVFEACLQEASLRSGDPAECDELPTEEGHDDCLFAHIAVGTEIACDEFLLEENRAVC